MEVYSVLYSSLKSYFNRLANTGYVKIGDVRKLIVLSFIEEMLDSNVATFISESDYTVISNALTCLIGTTCLIPYADFSNIAAFDWRPLDYKAIMKQLNYDEERLSEKVWFPIPNDFI